MIDIIDIRNKNEYPDKDKQTFMTLAEYQLAAEKSIKFFAPRIKAGLVSELLHSEDAIAIVAHAMMIADWKYKEGKGMTRYNYRNNYAFFAIRSFVVRRSKALKKTGYIKSLDFDMGDEQTFYKVISDGGTTNPLDCMMEEDERISDIVDHLYDGTITEKQSKCIQMYYFDGLTYEQIGNKMGVTKERVRQNINNGVQKIREKMDV